MADKSLDAQKTGLFVRFASAFFYSVQVSRAFYHHPVCLISFYFLLTTFLKATSLALGLTSACRLFVNQLSEPLPHRDNGRVLWTCTPVTVIVMLLWLQLLHQDQVLAGFGFY